MKEINKKLLDKNKQFTILKKLNLTNKKFIDIFFEGTRDDKNIDIYECKKTGCLFLSKVKTNLDYYKKKKGYFSDFQDYKNNTYKDDKRRSDFIKKNFRNKSLLDVGAGTGQFADLVFKSLKEITLVEPDNYLSKRLKKTYPVYDIVDHVDNKFDIITLYHVLEHIDNPLEFLSFMRFLIISNSVAESILLVVSSKTIIRLFSKKHLVIANLCISPLLNKLPLLPPIFS